MGGIATRQYTVVVHGREEKSLRRHIKVRIVLSLIYGFRATALTLKQYTDIQTKEAHLYFIIELLTNAIRDMI